MSWLAARAATRVALLGLGIVFAGGAATNAQQSQRDPIVTEAANPASLSASATMADRPIWKRVTLGRYRGVSALREALEAARVRVGDTADEILGRPAFSFSTMQTPVDLVLLTAAELGFEGAASLADIHRRAMQLGLELCPAEVAPLLRLAYPEQPVGEFLRVAMKPVATYRGTPVDLTVANGGTGPILIGGESRLDLMLTPGTKLVFVRPQRIARPTLGEAGIGHE